GVAAAVHADAPARLAAAVAAQVRRIRQRVARRRELADKRVLRAAQRAVIGADRREVRRGRRAGDEGIAGGVDGDGRAVLGVGLAQVGRVSQGRGRGVDFTDERVLAAAGGRLVGALRGEVGGGGGADDVGIAADIDGDALAGVAAAAAQIARIAPGAAVGGYFGHE